MPRYIAFLRAINVGGHTVPMARLRALFEGWGFAGVETFIASGNVVFETPGKSARRLEAQIADNLNQALGYAVATFLRTPREVTAAAAPPFSTAAVADAHALYIAFVGRSPEPAAVARLMAWRSANDDFQVRGREVYWLCRQKQSESKFSNASLERALGQPATLRGLNTVRQIAARYGAEAAPSGPSGRSR